MLPGRIADGDSPSGDVMEVRLFSSVWMRDYASLILSSLSLRFVNWKFSRCVFSLISILVAFLLFPVRRIDL